MSGATLGASQSWSNEVLNFRLRIIHSFLRPGRRREVFALSQEHRNAAVRSPDFSAKFRRRGPQGQGVAAGSTLEASGKCSPSFESREWDGRETD